uniref:SCP domain-containing protein n=1 Tax=Panagrolaimus sp. PS1159 TaxID=55785 RepID=A0AC35FEK7_9BILA
MMPRGTSQTRTKNGITLIYENLDTTVPQSTFQKYIDMIFKAYPKQCAKYNPNCPKQLGLITNASYDGAAFNGGNQITVGGPYAKANPNDVNMIAHETFHSVQAYPNRDPLWITEPLASFAGLEFAVDNWSLDYALTYWKYQSTDHYTQSYGDTPRFYVYLEKRFPGIVKYIDSIMRNNQQGSGAFWMNFTGETVDQLWADYVRSNAVVCPTGDGVATWNTATRDFALKLMNEKRSQIANGTFVMSNGAIAPAAKNMNKLTYSCEYENAIQNYMSTCKSFTLGNTFGFSLVFPWVVNSINEALTLAVPYYFGFTVSNSNGNAMLTQGSAQFAYDNATTIGCGFTKTPCSTDIKSEIYCVVGPVLPSSSPVYTVGSKCTSNSQCTRAGYSVCDIQSGLCTPPPTTSSTTTTTTTTTTTKAPATTQPTMPGCPNGNGVTTWNTATRDFALKLMNEKRSQIANGTFVMSNGAIAPAAKNMNKLTYSCEYEIAIQNYMSTCKSFTLGNTFGFSLGFPWVVNSINDALTTGVPYYFGFTVANQNGSAMVTQGPAQFAYDQARLIGCGFTNTPCSSGIKSELYCFVGPVLPSSSPVYTIGSKCTSNS